MKVWAGTGLASILPASHVTRARAHTLDWAVAEHMRLMWQELLHASVPSNAWGSCHQDPPGGRNSWVGTTSGLSKNTKTFVECSQNEEKRKTTFTGDCYMVGMMFKGCWGEVGCRLRGTGQSQVTELLFSDWASVWPWTSQQHSSLSRYIGYS